MKNKYIFNVKEGYCKIYCKDKFGLIDIEDYNKVKDYTWRINNGYLLRTKGDKKDYIIIT